MRFTSMKMGWDICSSPPWVTFYPYTMFQNPISWPSHNKCRKTIIIQKVLVTQSCNIVHCNWHTQKLICADLQVCEHFFPVANLWFFSFCQGEFRKQPKFHILFILTGNNALKWLEWCIFKVWGMLNSMALVASPYDKWFMKNHNFRRHIAANGVQIHENGMGHMQQSSLGHILPLHHVSELNILTFP